MEKSTREKLELAQHLLVYFESPDPEVLKEIDRLQNEVAGLIHLCNVGHETAAMMGYEQLQAQIDALALRVVAISDTDPAPPPKTEE